MTDQNQAEAARGSYELSRRHDAATIEQFWIGARRGGAAYKLLSAATLAFFDLGYHGASTREIANRAGMSPTALYVHFESKQALLNEIQVVGHTVVRDLLLQSVSRGDELLQRLRLVVAEFAAWHAERHVLAQVLNRELRSLSPENFAISADIRKHSERLIRGVIEELANCEDYYLPDIDGILRLVVSFCVDVSR